MHESNQNANDAYTIREQLIKHLANLDSVAVAFSGGVDSAVVAKASFEALGDRSIAVTADSPSLPSGELVSARECARQIGIRHRVVKTHELASSKYARNQGDRCYWCKNELYQHLFQIIEQVGFAHIVNGTNIDDLGDYRPGLSAARAHQVLSPLVECRLDKRTVRAIARSWHLDVWDKPAGPCLASRIAPGVMVTEERLRLIDRAERFICELGFSSVRVRIHHGELARIEVDASQIARLAENALRHRILNYLRGLGFGFITFDLMGFRSGSMNGLVQLNPLHE